MYRHLDRETFCDRSREVIILLLFVLSWVGVLCGSGVVRRRAAAPPRRATRTCHLPVDVSGNKIERVNEKTKS
jgi:hypothetical protein